MSDSLGLIDKLPRDVQDIFISTYASVKNSGESTETSLNIAWEAVFSVYVRQSDGTWGLKKDWGNI